jgi:hypothetical protein
MSIEKITKEYGTLTKYFQQKQPDPTTPFKFKK